MRKRATAGSNRAGETRFLLLNEALTQSAVYQRNYSKIDLNQFIVRFNLYYSARFNKAF